MVPSAIADAEVGSPAALLDAAEAKLRKFQTLYSQFASGSGILSSQTGGLSWRDLPTPGSTPGRPSTSHAAFPMRRHSGPVGTSATTMDTSGGVIKGQQAPTVAWGPNAQQTSELPHHLQRGSGDDSERMASASAELLSQYRVAAATSEQLASKVLILQQQLAVQVCW